MAKSWNEVVALPAYQALTPEKQERLRNAYFDEVLAPALDYTELATAREVFDAETAPPAPPQPNSSLLGDVVDLGQKGFYDAAGGVLDLAGLDSGAEWLYDQGKAQEETLTPETRAARAQPLFDDQGDYYLGEGFTNPRAWLAAGAETLGGMALPIPGGALAKAAIRPLLGLGRAATVAKEALLAEGLTARAATAGARQAAPDWRDTAAMVAGYGGMEGAVSGGLSEREVRERALAMPWEQVQQDPAYWQAVQAENGDLEAAKVRWAEDLGKAAGLKVALPTALLGAGAGHYYDKLIGGGGTGSRLRNIGQGATTEALEEVPQAAVETLAQNQTLQQVDPNIGLTDGLVANMLTGAALGGLAGGTIAGVMPKGRRPAGEADPGQLPPGTDPMTGEALPPGVDPTTGGTLPPVAPGTGPGMVPPGGPGAGLPGGVPPVTGMGTGPGAGMPGVPGSPLGGMPPPGQGGMPPAPRVEAVGPLSRAVNRGADAQELGLGSVVPAPTVDPADQARADQMAAQEQQRQEEEQLLAQHRAEQAALKTQREAIKTAQVAQAAGLGGGPGQGPQAATVPAVEPVRGDPTGPRPDEDVWAPEPVQDDAIELPEGFTGADGIEHPPGTYHSIVIPSQDGAWWLNVDIDPNGEPFNQEVHRAPTGPREAAQVSTNPGAAETPRSITATQEQPDADNLQGQGRQAPDAKTPPAEVGGEPPTGEVTTGATANEAEAFRAAKAALDEAVASGRVTQEEARTAAFLARATGSHKAAAEVLMSMVNASPAEVSAAVSQGRPMDLAAAGLPSPEAGLETAAPGQGSPGLRRKMGGLAALGLPGADAGLGTTVAGEGAPELKGEKRVVAETPTPPATVTPAEPTVAPDATAPAQQETPTTAALARLQAHYAAMGGLGTRAKRIAARAKQGRELRDELAGRGYAVNERDNDEGKVFAVTVGPYQVVARQYTDLGRRPAVAINDTRTGTGEWVEEPLLEGAHGLAALDLGIERAEALAKAVNPPAGGVSAEPPPVGVNPSEIPTSSAEMSPGAGVAAPADNALVSVVDIYGNSHRVKQRELDNPALTLLPIYDKAGNFPGKKLHRENIAPDPQQVPRYRTLEALRQGRYRMRQTVRSDAQEGKLLGNGYRPVTAEADGTFRVDEFEGVWAKPANREWGPELREAGNPPGEVVSAAPSPTGVKAAEPVAIASRLADAQDRLGARRKFVEANDGRPFSGPMRSQPRKTVMVTPSAQQPGKWQVTYLDQQGEPAGDSQTNSYAEAVNVANQYGIDWDQVAVDEPAGDPQRLPWQGASTDDQENRWYGSRVRLTAQDRRGANAGLVREGEAELVRVLNDGKLLEVRWPGTEGTHRADARDYGIEVVALADNQIEADAPVARSSAPTAATPSRPSPGRYQQGEVASREGQMTLANRSLRTALLTQLNDRAGNPYTDDELVNAADDRIDAIRDYLIAAMRDGDTPDAPKAGEEAHVDPESGERNPVTAPETRAAVAESTASPAQVLRYVEERATALKARLQAMREEWRATPQGRALSARELETQAEQASWPSGLVVFDVPGDGRFQLRATAERIDWFVAQIKRAVAAAKRRPAPERRTVGSSVPAFLKELEATNNPADYENALAIREARGLPTDGMAATLKNKQAAWAARQRDIQGHLQPELGDRVRVLKYHQKGAEGLVTQNSRGRLMVALEGFDTTPLDSYTPGMLAVDGDASWEGEAAGDDPAGAANTAQAPAVASVQAEPDPPALAQALRAGDLSAAGYWLAMGLTEDDMPVPSAANLPEVRARVPYLALMDEARALAGTLGVAKRALAELEVIEREYENPFTTRLAAARALPPILRQRFKTRFAAVEAGDAAKRQYQDAKYAAYREQVIAEAQRIADQQAVAATQDDRIPGVLSLEKSQEARKFTAPRGAKIGTARALSDLVAKAMDNGASRARNNYDFEAFPLGDVSIVVNDVGLQVDGQAALYFTGDKGQYPRIVLKTKDGRYVRVGLQKPDRQVRSWGTFTVEDVRSPTDRQKLDEALGNPASPTDAKPQAPQAETQAKPALQEHRYALVNRPAGVGAVPKEGMVRVEPRPDKGQDHYDMARHGFVIYDRELTAKEQQDFELAPALDGAGQEALAAELANDMEEEYVAGALEMAAEDPGFWDQAVASDLERKFGRRGVSVGRDFNARVLEKLKARQTQAPSKAEVPEQNNDDPEAFVESPAGGLDFGRIEGTAAKAIGQADGPIRLQVGYQDEETGRGYGKAHIDRKVRAEELAQEGYLSTEALVEDVGRHYNEIHAGKNGTYILAKLNGKAKIAFVTVKHGEDGLFYSVGSGLVSRQDYLKNKPKLWDRAQSNQPKLPSAVSGQQPRLTASIDDSAPQDVTTKLENFGAELPPRRRKLAAKLTEALSDDDIASQPLSKIWPAAENEGIEDTFAAAVAFTARAKIPNKPRAGGKLTHWVMRVKQLRDLAGAVVSGQYSREQFLAERKRALPLLRDWDAQVRLLEQLDREHWPRIADVHEAPDSQLWDNTQKQWVPSAYATVKIDGHNRIFNGNGDILQHLDAIKALLGEQAATQKLKFEIRVPRSGEVKAYINKAGDGERRRLMTFTSVEEARAALKDRYDELVTAWEAVKARDNITERDLRGAVNRPRAGQDWRQGRDITTEDFANQFGFRGGEFGKWMKQGRQAQERQAYLNSAYDALMDLADILGVPPKALSLNGTLGIAFGARGSGWAAAHYEPDTLIINLTKPRGAGSLAHEWFHALDNYFARARGNAPQFTGDQDAYRDQNFITYKPERLMVKVGAGRMTPITATRLAELRKANPNARQFDPENWMPDPAHPEGVRPEVEVRFAALVEALNASPMLDRARRLDGRKSGEGYWSRVIERAARAFENYVMKRMLDQGYVNDFLANVLPADEIDKNDARYPYLLPDEIAPIAAAFDELLGTLQTREDDAGNVALFSKRPQGKQTSPLTIEDAEYLAAVQRGDMETARRLVDEAARAAGYTVAGWHGSRGWGFSVFKTGSEGGVHFGTLPQAEMRGGRGNARRFWLKMESTARLRDRGQFKAIPRGRDSAIYLNRYEGISVETVESIPGAVLDRLTDAQFKKRVPEAADSQLVKYAWQIKSADPITYDDNGQVIPLSQRFDLDNDDIRFAKSAHAPGAGGSVTAITQAVRRLMRPWANAPRPVVFQGMNDPLVDAEVRQAYAEESARRQAEDPKAKPDLVEGFYFRGKVYINAEAVRNVADLERVLRHETLGHAGLRGLFGGPALDALLDRIARARRGEVAAMATARGLDMTDQTQRRQAAEEVLAELAQTRPEIGWVRELLAIVKAKLREWGVLDANKLSDAEILREYVIPARNFIERGRMAEGRMTGAAVPAFAKGLQAGMPETLEVDGQQRPTTNSEGRPIHPTEEGVRNFWKWFGDSKVVDGQGRPLVVYHGTPNEFTVFESRPGRNFLFGESDEVQRHGIFVTPNAVFAEEFSFDERRNSKQPMALFANMQKPLDLREGIDGQDEMALRNAGFTQKIPWAYTDYWQLFDDDVGEEFVSAARSAGFDGALLSEVNDSGREVPVFVMFGNRHQLKDARENTGAFDSSNPDIRFSLARDADAGGSPLGGGKAFLDSVQQWLGDSWQGRVASENYSVLGALTLRQLAEVGAKWLPGIQLYDRLRTTMETRRNVMMEEAGRLGDGVDSWARKHPEEARAVFELENETTLAQVDPSDYQVLMIPLKLGPGPEMLRNWAATEENVKELRKRARAWRRSKQVRERELAAYYSAAADKLNLALRAERRRQAALPELARKWAALSSGQQHLGADGAPFATEQAARAALTARRWPKGVVTVVEAVPGGWAIQELGGQQVYTRMRDLYKKRSDEMREALIKRIEGLQGLDEESKRALAARIRAEFENPMDEKGNPRIGPYFPLQRFGRFYVAAQRLPTGEARTWGQVNGEPFTSEASARSALNKRPDLHGVSAKVVPLEDGTGFVLEERAEEGFWLAESPREQRQTAAALEAEGWVIQRQGLTAVVNQDLEGVSEGFVAEAVKKLQDKGAKDEADMLYQMYLTTLSQMSIRKHFKHRKGTAGYSADQLRAFGWNMTRLAHQVSKLEHLPDMERALLDIQEEVKQQQRDDRTFNATRANAMLKEVKLRHDWVANPDNAPWTNALSALGFVFYLGVSPAAALVNLSQVPIVGLPVLAARYGSWGAAAKGLTTAFVDVARGFNPAVLKGFITGRPLPSDAANLTEEERQAFAEWDKTGARDRTQAHNLAGIGDADNWLNGPTFNRVMGAVSSLFHAAEVVNRDATLLAAYRLGRAKGLEHDTAVMQAEAATWEAHFDYSNANRARMMQGNVAKVLLMFKNYSQHVLYFLGRNLFLSVKGESAEVKREARTKFSGMVGMTALFAGAAGLPVGGFFVMANLLQGMFGDDDEPWDAEIEFRNWLAATFPEGVSDVLDRGAVNTLTGLDFSSRVSIGDLIWRAPDRDLDGAGMFQHVVEQMLGPVGGLAARPFTMYDELREGRWVRAAEAASPKFLRDLVQSGRFAEEGVLTRKGAEILAPGELSSFELFAKAMGMNPDDLAVRYQQNSAIKLYEQRITDRRRVLVAAAAMAIMAKDTQGQAAAREKIAAFNRVHPEIKISVETLKRSVRAREMMRERAKGGIAINPKLDYLREQAGGFGEQPAEDEEEER